VPVELRRLPYILLGPGRAEQAQTSQGRGAQWAPGGRHSGLLSPLPDTKEGGLPTTLVSGCREATCHIVTVTS